YAVMEVSSHALVLKRTYGIHFAAAVFTNLSRDHFDFHRDFEDYFSAKKILFDQIDRNARRGIVNLDDPYGKRLAAELGSAAVTFGRSEEAQIRPGDGFVVDVSGLHGVVLTPQGPIEIASPLLGEPNLYNWMGAIGAALSIGIGPTVIQRGIRNLRSVRGRFERVGEGKPAVIVDYAHKPDALEKLLNAVRALAGGRKVTLLIGCGGDRDKGKRPEMGAIAARLADFTVLTSDNPRSERPEQILDEMERGVREVPSARYTRVTDRRQAIEQAVSAADDEDVIVIAGKGHETYQVVGDQILHFDDREEVEAALRKRAEKTTVNLK
ncbi:MAG TPA: UDP-N-acetylmuramoyl-L-alanyl-D-glutamate--2,6-diaminopimelate ligase, partial [Thermoanaerobaculia bacterium]|nr:UDP-N-acetylmuramoyl-L-alanyl-D-glutamate--2,6-diaminopimelate ligase [Thermoanaerobaculia bacterium]